MTHKIVSLLIQNPRSAQPQHCVAASQLIMTTLPQPQGEWQKFEVTLEGKTIIAVKSSGSATHEQVFSTPGQEPSIFGVPVTIGDNERWLTDQRINSRPPVYALFSAMQGNTEDLDNDGPFAMNTISKKPALKLVNA